MDKKYRINSCFWCPKANTTNGDVKGCWAANRTIKKEEIEQRNDMGELEAYIIPEWCPLEDYE